MSSSDGNRPDRGESPMSGGDRLTGAARSSASAPSPDARSEESPLTTRSASDASPGSDGRADSLADAAAVSPPEGGEMGRRGFVKSAAGACTTLSLLDVGDVPPHSLGEGGEGVDALPLLTMEDLPTHLPSDRPGNFDEPGYMSRDAYRMMAETERRMRAVTGQPALEEVDATEELGVSPGDEIAFALATSNLEGKMLYFPEGEYILEGGVTIAGQNFGIKGPDATFVIPSETFVEIKLLPTNRGIFGPFTIDQSAPGAIESTLLETGGRLDYTGVTKVGSVDYTRTPLSGDATSAMMRPKPVGGGYIRVVGWRCMGGGNAGSHDWSSNCSIPPGFDGGPGEVASSGVGIFDGSQGTIDLVGCQLRGWENGVYGSKTEGTAVRVLGGGYVNNNNASVRVAGSRSVADGVSVLLDQRIYNVERMPGRYKPGGIQGVNPVRSESKGGQYEDPADSRCAPLKNLDVRAVKVESNDVTCAGGMNGLVRVQGTVGNGSIQQCRFESHVPDTPMIVVDSPGQGKYPKPPGPYGIHMSNLDFHGTNRPTTIRVRDRPNSTIADSCLHMEDAGPGNIQGISGGNTTNVSYGPNCGEDQGVTGTVGSINASRLANLTGNFTGNFSNYTANYTANGSGGFGGGLGVASAIAGIISTIGFLVFGIALAGIVALVILFAVSFIAIYYAIRAT